MESANLSDPAVRAEYDRRINEAAPKVVKFLNPADPEDILWLQQENANRALRNVAPIAEAQMHTVTRPLRHNELWGGCIVRVAGEAYWGDKKKAVSLRVDQVLLVAQGERLQQGEASPDATFSAFAPAADLAPPNDPWASMR